MKRMTQGSARPHRAEDLGVTRLSQEMRPIGVTRQTSVPSVDHLRHLRHLWIHLWITPPASHSPHPQ